MVIEDASKKKDLDVSRSFFYALFPFSELGPSGLGPLFGRGPLFGFVPLFGLGPLLGRGPFGPF